MPASTTPSSAAPRRRRRASWLKSSWADLPMRLAAGSIRECSSRSRPTSASTIHIRSFASSFARAPESISDSVFFPTSARSGRSMRPASISDLASRIVWLDGLVQNPDRTVKNPNLLWSQGQLWLIDHGASLGFQHAWSRVTEQSPRAPGWPAATHVLHGRATLVRSVDEVLMPRLSRGVLELAVDAVPDGLLSENSAEARRRRRAAYVAFLWKRLKSPRPFVS